MIVVRRPWNEVAGLMGSRPYVAYIESRGDGEFSMWLDEVRVRELVAEEATRSVAPDCDDDAVIIDMIAEEIRYLVHRFDDGWTGWLAIDDPLHWPALLARAGQSPLPAHQRAALDR